MPSRIAQIAAEVRRQRELPRTERLTVTLTDAMAREWATFRGGAPTPPRTSSARWRVVGGVGTITVSEPPEVSTYRVTGPELFSHDERLDPRSYTHYVGSRTLDALLTHPIWRARREPDAYRGDACERITLEKADERFVAWIDTAHGHILRKSESYRNVHGAWCLSNAVETGDVFPQGAAWYPKSATTRYFLPRHPRDGGVLLRATETAILAKN